MRSSWLNRWLEQYCQHELREPLTESILYRILNEAHVQRPPPKDRILCMDAPEHVQKVRIAISRIDQDQRNCLWMKFSYPMKDTGQLYTADEISRFLGISRRSYYRCVKAGKRCVAAELTRMAA